MSIARRQISEKFEKFFSGDLEQEEFLYQFFVDKLNQLTAAAFNRHYNDAMNDYLKLPFGTNLLTFGVSYIHRLKKAKDRYPKDVNDSNVKLRLKDILLGPGNDDSYSFKYCLIAEIFLYIEGGNNCWDYYWYARTDQQTKSVIAFTLKALGCQNHTLIVDKENVQFTLEHKASTSSSQITKLPRYGVFYKADKPNQQGNDYLLNDSFYSL